MNGVSGTDIETLHAVIGGALAVWNFNSGQDAYQLLGTTGRVAGGHYHDFNLRIAVLLHRQRHRGNGFGFVVLDADQGFFGGEHFAHDRRAFDDIVGAFAHQYVVAGDEGLAFRTVDDQRIQLARFSRIQFEMGRKHRTTESDHAGIAQIVAGLDW